MAIVKNEELFFNGRKIKRKIACNSKGIFSTELPEEVVELLGGPKVIEASSLADVEREWSKMTGQFNAAQTTTRKVILCSFDADAVIRRDEEIVFKKGSPGFMHDGVSVGFSAAVYIETSVKVSGGQIRKSYRVESSSIPSSFAPENNRTWDTDGCHLIEWSEEREAAFVDLCTKFEELILRLDWVFKDGEKLLSILDNNQKLLPG